MSDPRRVETIVRRTLAAWRRACAELGAAETVEPPIGYDVGEALGAIDERDSILAATIPWLQALEAERQAWPDRVMMAADRRRSLRIEGRDELCSWQQLRLEVLRGLPPRVEGELSVAAVTLQGRVLDALDRRVYRDRELSPSARHGVVEGVGEPMVQVAERLLARTADAFEELVRPTSYRMGVHATLGARADEGWPARLTHRWLSEVVADEMTVGLRLKLGAPPRPLGATSFARALGQLGVAVLDAATSMPLGLHQHPAGARRHCRRALFAGIVAETTFATRCLGLGAERARTHVRHVSAAMLAALRMDALRVVACDAFVRDGRAASTDLFVELASKAVGSEPPAVCFGVLPELHPMDAASLAGSLLAFARRRDLVQTFDEDWFRNPRAVGQLRHQDTLSRDALQTGEVRFDDCIGELIRRLEVSS